MYIRENSVSKCPNGLQRVVGEKGVKPSEGDRQRMALARMLARSPKIMIFDEAASALDLATEKVIQQWLLKKYCCARHAFRTDEEKRFLCQAIQ